MTFYLFFFLSFRPLTRAVLFCDHLHFPQNCSVVILAETFKVRQCFEINAFLFGELIAKWICKFIN